MKIGKYFWDVFEKNDVYTDVYDEMPLDWHTTDEEAESGSVWITNDKEIGLLLTDMEEFLHTCNGEFEWVDGLKNPYEMYEELSPNTKTAIENLRTALNEEIDYFTPENERKSFALKTVLTDIINDYLM